MELETKLRDRFVLTHPSDAARVLESLPVSDLAEAVLALPIAASSELLPRLAPYSAANALEVIAAPLAARALESTRPDAAAAVLRAMDSGRRRSILDSMSTHGRKSLERLLRYADGSAGALMDPAIISLAENLSVADALERLRRRRQHALYYLYIVNDDQRLVGVVNMRELMAARSDQHLGAVAVRAVESLSARASRESIVMHPAWKRFHALPVVDVNGRFLGALRYETVRQLEESVRDGGPLDPSAETSAALAELFGVGLKGLAEWAASAVLGPSGSRGRKP